LSRILEGRIVYKPFKGKKIDIIVNIPKNWKSDLERLSELCNSDDISMSVRLSTKYIYLSYDEERLNGYSVDEVSRRAEVSEIKKQHHTKEIESALIKDVYRLYYEKQQEEKLSGRIKGRCIAIDMNPTNIGYCILDKTECGKIKIVHCGLIGLEKLCGKSGKPSTHPFSKHLSNKRHYEITNVVKWLFNIAVHYKCASFVIEDLDLKNSGDLSREANRKIYNVWNRELFVSCLIRRCNETGIELIKVNPCYSSFIGNIQHPYADACNASIEIGRRGLWKYEKGGLYPNITKEDICTLETKFGDVVRCSTDSNWVKIYKSLKESFDGKEFSHRLRARLSEVKVPYDTFSMNSCRSNVYLTIFH
jgi:IS605 OrfB family transposase